MEPTAYQMNLFIKALVLRVLREKGPMSGEVLAARVEERCSAVGAQLPGLDFVGWAGTTIWGLLGNFEECDYLECSSPPPMDAAAWQTAHIALTSRGEEFLLAAERELGSFSDPSRGTSADVQTVLSSPLPRVPPLEHPLPLDAHSVEEGRRLGYCR